VTNHEKELVAALEADIKRWEVVAAFFENSVNKIEVIGGENILGTDYARGLRELIAQHRDLIERVEKG
jgi:hypothetical protein